MCLIPVLEVAISICPHIARAIPNLSTSRSRYSHNFIASAISWTLRFGVPRLAHGLKNCPLSDLSKSKLVIAYAGVIAPMGAGYIIKVLYTISTARGRGYKQPIQQKPRILTDVRKYSAGIEGEREKPIIGIQMCHRSSE
jgi:hypothetical protein